MKRNPLLTSLRTRSTVAAVAVAAVAVLALCGVAVGASTSVPSKTQDHTAAKTTAALTKPTVVLVHGGWADSSGWNAEIAALQKKGYPVIAPANPLRGLTSDADYVRSVLQTIEGPIVLVGHSYGGAVISNAARGVDNVEALVYIAAFAPDTGEIPRAAGHPEPRNPHHPRRPGRAALPAARRHRRRPVHQGRGLPRGVRR